MSATLRPFTAADADGVTGTAGTSSSVIALPSRDQSGSVLVCVIGTSDVFLKWGTGATTVTMTGASRGQCFLARTKEVVSLPRGVTHAAVIAAADSEIQFFPGVGA